MSKEQINKNENYVIELSSITQKEQTNENCVIDIPASSKTILHLSGEKQIITYNKEGILDGLYQHISKDGSVIEEYIYSNGFRNSGKYEKGYDKEKQDKLKKIYKSSAEGCQFGFYHKYNNKKEGLYQMNYPNGALYEECLFIDGLIDGLYKVYHDNGQKYAVCNVINGVIIDVLEAYDEEGRNCVLPQGTITVWKACRVKQVLLSPINVYVKLEVDEKAQRVTVFGKIVKGRVSAAKVINIIDGKGNEYEEAWNFVNGVETRYKKGEMVYPDSFDSSMNSHCSHGINVFPYMDQCDQFFYN